MPANLLLTDSRQFKADIMAKLLAATIDRDELEEAASGMSDNLKAAIKGASIVANAIIAQAKIKDY